MKVIKAKTAGFCFGVKRAVDTVYKQVDSCEGKIYTYGPIIHNEEVVKDMESKGVIVLRSEEELDRLSGGTVIIRSHGVEKRIYDKMSLMFTSKWKYERAGRKLRFLIIRSPFKCSSKTFCFSFRNCKC